MNTTIKIGGMHCDGCASRVRRVLEKESGVREADVSFEDGEARVKYNEHSVTTERLRELVEGTGYTVESGA